MNTALPRGHEASSRTIIPDRNTPREVFIVELKPRVAGHAQRDQLKRYMDLPSIVAGGGARGRTLHGVLIAPYIKESVLPAADDRISLYTYRYRHGSLDLERVAGRECFRQEPRHRPPRPRPHGMPAFHSRACRGGHVPTTGGRDDVLRHAILHSVQVEMHLYDVPYLPKILR